MSDNNTTTTNDKFKWVKWFKDLPPWAKVVVVVVGVVVAAAILGGIIYAIIYGIKYLNNDDDATTTDQTPDNIPEKITDEEIDEAAKKVIQYNTAMFLFTMITSNNTGYLVPIVISSNTQDNSENATNWFGTGKKMGITPIYDYGTFKVKFDNTNVIESIQSITYIKSNDTILPDISINTNASAAPISAPVSISIGEDIQSGEFMEFNYIFFDGTKGSLPQNMIDNTLTLITSEDLDSPLETMQQETIILPSTDTGCENLVKMTFKNMINNNLCSTITNCETIVPSATFI
jgi:hypothetical protein